MAPSNKSNGKPAITTTRSDRERLSRLAGSYLDRTPQVAEDLLTELERARIVEDGRIAADVVRMGSTLRFTSDLGEDRRVTLVFPGEADIAEGKVRCSLRSAWRSSACRQDSRSIERRAMAACIGLRSRPSRASARPGPATPAEPRAAL